MGIRNSIRPQLVLIQRSTQVALKMKLLIIAALVACTLANPVLLEDKDFEECTDVLGFEACEALEPMPYMDNAYFLTDEQMTKMVLEKLRIFQWVVGKIAGPKVEGFVRNFIEEHRDQVVNALKKGGFVLVGMRKNIVGDFLAKIG